MQIFTEAERAYLPDEIRVDGQGREVLAGLTFEETTEFWSLVRLAARGEWSGEAERHRYRVLSLKLHRALGLV